METSMPQAASSTSVGFNAATGTDAPIRALVLCSGGVDSTTLLAMAVKRYGAQNVYALSISSHIFLTDATLYKRICP